jgi:hypothetical protein
LAFHGLFTVGPGHFTSVSRPERDAHAMADFFALAGIIVFVVVMLGLIWALERV